MFKKYALIIVDLQNDFCPGGALEVKDGDTIIEKINNISEKFFKVIATQDWHPENHISFAVTHNKNIYEKIKVRNIEQVLWPKHCVAGSFGAELHRHLKTDNIDLILRKGTDPEIDSYSAFFENDRKTPTGLEGYLKNHKIREVYICGLATDYCVYFTAVDAVKTGFKTSVLIDASRGVDVPEGNLEKVILDMKKKGIRIIETKDLK